MLETQGATDRVDGECGMQEKQEDSFTIKVPSVKKIKREVKKVQRKVMGQVDELTKPISKKLGFSEQVRLKKDGSFVTVVPQAPPGMPLFDTTPPSITRSLLGSRRTDTPRPGPCDSCI